MPLIIPVGFAQVAFKWALSGDPEPMVTTVGYDVSALGGAVIDLLDDLNADYNTNFGAGARLLVYTYLGCTAYVGQDGGPPAVVEAPFSSPGTSPSQAPPSNCAVLVRKLTALGGRRGRGRNYFPPFNLAETSVDANGNLDGAYISGTESNTNAWLGLGKSPVLLHSSGGLSAPPAPTPIISFRVQSKIATQRQRMRR